MTRTKATRKPAAGPQQPPAKVNDDKAEKIRIVDALFGRTHPQMALLQRMAFTSLSLLRVIAEKMFDDTAEIRMMDRLFGGDDEPLPCMKGISRPLSVKYPPHVHTLLLAMMVKLSPPDDKHDDGLETASLGSSEGSQDSSYYLEATDSWTVASGMTNEYTQVTYATKEEACPGFWESLFGSGGSVISRASTWWEFPAPQLKQKESFDYHMLMNLESIQVTKGSDAIKGTYERFEDDLLRFVKPGKGSISHEIRPSLYEGQEVWAIVRHVTRNGEVFTRDTLYVADFTDSIPPKHDWVCVLYPAWKPPPPDPELKFVVVL